VALKLPVAGEGEDARVRLERFLADAEAASGLRHPGIVSVVGHGFTPSGQAYLVTEYLEGATLRGWLAGSVASDLGRRLAIARQLAAAGAAAHDRRIVHGALRPENVFLLGGDSDAVKLTDFGLGRLLQGATVDELAYASPERCRRPQRIDINDDVYAFGCLLYEMVCGRPPFPYRDRDALVAAHLGEPPQPPRSLDGAIPVGLERLILATLCKAPAGRPRSLRLVEEALDRIAGGGDDGGWSAAREDVAVPRLTPLGHVHLRPRELRTGKPSASETPPRRTPLGQAHLHLRGLVVDNRGAPVETPARAVAPVADEPPPVAVADAAVVDRSGPRLWWLVAVLAVLAGAVLAVRGLRSHALEATPSTTAPVTR
jgi:serine/threonine protein kinase